MSQRDTNYYEFLNEPETQSKILSSFVAHWTEHVKPKWTGPASCKPSVHIHSTYSPPPKNSLHNDADTLDVLLTRDLTRFHIIDFNPYAPRTDALLFTYDELATLFASATTSTSSSSAASTPAPTLRVIDSRAHPAATRNAPQYQHNMVPLEALTLSEGLNVGWLRLGEVP